MTLKVIPNPEQEELLILIYKLLEEEITPMNSASIDEFLNDTSFIGKFISSYMNKRELKVFLTVLLNPLILSIENSGLECLDMSLINIKKVIDKIKEPSKEIVTLESLLKTIPKTTISFKNNGTFENEQEEDEIEGNISEKHLPEINRESIFSKNSANNNDFESNTNVSNINNEYQQELTLDKIYDKIMNKNENQEMKDFYSYQLEQITNDPDIFTNSGLNLVLNNPYFKNNKSGI